MENAIKDFILLFTSILYEALPFIVLGAVIAGLLEELVPQEAVSRLVPKNPVLGVLLGALLGLVFPMCECGIVVVMKRLLRKGLPLSVCTSYMLAGPVVNPIVIASTVVAFAPHGAAGWGVIGFRLGMAFVVAVTAGLVVHSLASRVGSRALLRGDVLPAEEPPKGGLSLGLVDEPKPAPPAPRTFLQRVNGVTETALHDFVDITIFLIIGALLAATVGFFVSKEQIGSVSTHFPALSILMMMGLAVVLCLCSEADAFVAASFVTLHPAAKLAFLVLGPMMDLKLYLMYTRVFRSRLIVTIIACVVVQVFVYSLLLYYAWEPVFGLPTGKVPGTGQ